MGKDVSFAPGKLPLLPGTAWSSLDGGSSGSTWFWWFERPEVHVFEECLFRCFLEMSVLPLEFAIAPLVTKNVARTQMQ